ncbi:SAM-dependent methyltransferase [Bacillus sp. RG28]|uniref:SAM-dependent methyltransferase n=1 Tax=Gottfriedia endophytica TaxID=2820819 RepID=A0A940NMX9_9BACI|nr:SAM-dependent methyltransferase [Gottfriedia endophytica]MBP0724500.1 SAM-dependent methyltransferase [Gottfriedia endophytica]
MKDILREKIKESALEAIPFDEYMSLCLYHKEKGYYSRMKEKIGRKGDFYTSSTVSHIFSEVIASFFCHLVKNKIVEPIFFEFGSGNGRFAYGLLNYCQNKEPFVYRSMKYIAIEGSAYHRTLIQKNTEDFTCVEIVSSINSVQSPLNGLIFSNELFDAMPVKVVEFQINNWYEVIIGLNEENELCEKLLLLEDEECIQFLRNHQFTGSEGLRVEIPIKMNEFHHQLIDKCGNSIIVSIDYGNTREEWDEMHRFKGSLRGFYEHQLIENVLQYPGEMDLTTHIHWDELKKVCESNNGDNLYFGSQREFLISLGIFDWLVPHASTNPFSQEYKQNRAVQTFVMPGGMSDSFQVLIQSIGLAEDKISLIKAVF